MKKLLLLAVGAIAILTGCQEEKEVVEKEWTKVEPMVFEVAEKESAPVVFDYKRLPDYESVTDENIGYALVSENVKSIEIKDEGDNTYYLTVNMIATGAIRDEEPLDKQAKNSFKELSKFKDISKVNLIYLDENDELVLSTLLTREKLDRLDFKKAILKYSADMYVYIPQ